MLNLELWKKKRKELKLNYDELAKLSGVSKRTIEEIFRGNTPSPRIDTVQAIERVLGLVSNESKTLTEDETEVLNKYIEVKGALGEKGKNLIIEFCDALTDKFSR